MSERDDHQLLAEFASDGSESAFAALVARHANLVYSTALRFTGNPNHAEEITQAVFIILARKAGGLRPRVILSGWLYQTTRLTAANFVRIESRRQNREQEAYMQSISNEPDAAAWEKLAPFLDQAMGSLGETDRNAVVLRFFENKTAAEVAIALKLTEAAAHKRTSRALEKLRKIFSKRGVTLSAALIAGAVSGNSVHAMPATLAKSLTAVAITKGTTASGSTLALVKGSLKLMAWAKAQLAIIVGTSAILAAGTATVVVKETQAPKTYSWQVPFVSQTNFYQILSHTPPQVKIVPTKYPEGVNHGLYTESRQGIDSYEMKSLGIAVSPEVLVANAYNENPRWIAYQTKLPEKKYDYIVNVPRGSLPAFQDELRRALGLVGRYEIVETNVLLMKLAKPEVNGFKPAYSLKQSMGITNWAASSTNWLAKSDDGQRWTNTVVWFGQPLQTLQVSAENIFNQPIVNGTGLTNTYDFSFIYPASNSHQAWKEALLNQLGVELVPSRERIKMLVIESAKN